MTRKHAIREYSLVIEYYLISGTERNFLCPRNFSTEVTIFPEFYHAVLCRQVKERYQDVCYTKAAVRPLSYTDSRDCLWLAIFQIRVSFFSRPAVRRGKSREIAERVFN